MIYLTIAMYAIFMLCAAAPLVKAWGDRHGV